MLSKLDSRSLAARRGLSDLSIRNLFIIPTIAFLIVFNIFPLIYSLGYSFTDFSASSNAPAAFVGDEAVPALEKALGRRVGASLDLFSVCALKAAQEALAEAGLIGERLGPRAAVVMGYVRQAVDLNLPLPPMLAVVVGGVLSILTTRLLAVSTLPAWSVLR